MATKLIALSISLAFIGGFYLLFLGAFVMGGGVSAVKKAIQPHPVRRIALILLFLLAGLWFTWYIVSQDSCVYYWDYGHYWTMSVQQTRYLYSDPVFTMSDLIHTINENDYNQLLPTLVTLPIKVLGEQHSTYVCINYIMFLAPTFLVLGAFAVRLAEVHGLKQDSWKAFLLGMVLAVLMPVFWYAMLQGYIDVALLLPSSLLFLLALDWNGCSWNRHQIILDLLVAALLLTVILFRRHFAYFVIGYVFALGILSLWQLFADRPRSTGKGLLQITGNFALVGCTDLFILLAFFRQFLLHALFTNYGDMYSFYDSAWKIKLLSIPNSFGGLLFAAGVLGIIVLIVMRKTPRYMVFAQVSLAVTAFTFFTVQTMGNHHRYGISMQIYMMLLLTVETLLFSEKKAHRIAAGVLALLCLANFSSCYFPAARVVSAIPGVTGSVYNPVVREDLAQLHAMKDALNHLTEGSDRTVYVCASGNNLNGDLMNSLEKPDHSSPVHNLLGTSDTDLRDGFSNGLLYADILVVCDPPEGPNEISQYLSPLLLDEKSLGRHYSKGESFPLQNGVTATILIREEGYTKGDLEMIANHFSEVYPNHKELFAERILQVETTD